VKTLDESTVVRIMREEWNKRIDVLCQLHEAMTVDPPIEANGTDAKITPGLKLVHKKSRLRYTVDSVSPTFVSLRAPEGDTFVVDSDTLEKEYSID